MIASFDGRPQRTSAEFARHVLEVLLAVERSSDERRVVTVESTCSRPDWGDLPAVQLPAPTTA